MTSSAPIVGIDTTELDQFLSYAEKELSVSTTDQRHRFFDDLIRLSAKRFGMVKVRIVSERTAVPPTATIKLSPTREFVENIEHEIARRRREQADG